MTKRAREKDGLAVSELRHRGHRRKSERTSPAGHAIPPHPGPASIERERVMAGWSGGSKMICMVWSGMKGAGAGKSISESSDSEAEKKCRRGTSTSSRVLFCEGVRAGHAREG